MKIVRTLTTATLALLLAGAGAPLHAQQYGSPQGPPPRYGNGGPGGWDAPPGQLSDVQRRGFHDGIEGARKDFENHRQPNVNNRDEYRHPSVSGRDRHDYRMGFRQGYDAGVRHMSGGGRPR